MESEEEEEIEKKEAVESDCKMLGGMLRLMQILEIKHC